MRVHSPVLGLVLFLIVPLSGCQAVAASPARAFTDSAASADDSPTRPLGATGTRLVIIDTDMAIDDWPAILYLLNRPDVRILAITVTGAGESSCSAGIPNLLDLIHLAGRIQDPIPVACGDEEPTDGFHTFPDRWRQDADSLYGIPIPHVSVPQPPHDAIQLLRQSLQEAASPVSILTLGPLTNVAQLLQDDHGIRDSIRELVIMGGAVRVRGNLIVPGVTEHLTNTVAEWNIFVDPLAARNVFRSGLPIVLVPLDATNQVAVTRAFASDVKRLAHSKEARFLDALFDRAKTFIESGEWYFWDPLAAAVLADRSLCQYEQLTLDVTLIYAEATASTRHGFSSTRNDGRSRRHFDESSTGQTRIAKGGSSIQVCTQVDAAQFRRDFLRTINRNMTEEVHVE